MIWWIILLGAVQLGMVLLILPLKVKIRTVHANSQHSLEVKLFIAGFRLYRMHIPEMKIEEDPLELVTKEEKETQLSMKKEKRTESTSSIMKRIERSREFIKQIVGFTHICAAFLEHVHVKEWRWTSLIGTGDAAHTAVAYGLLYSVKSTLTGVISRYMKLDVQPQIRVEADFRFVRYDTSFSCMFVCRTGHAIIAAFLLLLHWKQRLGKG